MRFYFLLLLLFFIGCDTCSRDPALDGPLNIPPDEHSIVVKHTQFLRPQ